ncbi:MAG: hypothetical protein HQL76_14910 [Magnetococcales bacterium]|nr:hypothetical protein [Magnetococcales bacterium]
MNKIIIDTLSNSGDEKKQAGQAPQNKLMFDIEITEYDDQTVDADGQVVFYRSTCTTCSTS